MRIIRQKKQYGPRGRLFPIGRQIACLIKLNLAETEIHGIKADANIKRQTNLDCHGPRPLSNICHLPDLYSFSLQTIFEYIL